MKEVQLSNKNENPFYGLKNCLRIFNSSTTSINEQMLTDAYNEVKKNKEQRELLFSLIFSIGDITARQHNIFKGQKKDSGGNANREAFYIALNWLIKYHYDQFVKFLNAGLFNEYTCFDHLFRNRVKTKGTKVLQVYDMLDNAQYRSDLATYVYSVINGSNPFNKHLVAKFITLPRLSKRSKSKRILPETLKTMNNRAKFLAELSELMGWEYEFRGTYSNFAGYRNWRKEYNQELESVMFSSGKVKEFDKTGFIEWLNKIPSQARFRIRNRVMFEKDGVFKYPNLRDWFVEWEVFKESKQKEQRVLEEKVRQGTATQEDEEKLVKVKKQAKVTVGATNFNELYEQIRQDKIDKLKLESFINKVNLQYNTLVIVDDSWSMSGAPFNFAQFLASVCLVKNPDDDGRNLLGFFNWASRLYGSIDMASARRSNSIMRSTSTKIVKEPFVKPELSFYENYQRISKFCSAVFEGGGTSISSIPEGFKYMCAQDSEIRDALMNYPVWTIISDGEWNNMRSPEASINDFFRKCENYFGFRPFIIAIDIADNGWISASSLRKDHFSGIDNMIYIPSNPAQIEQILTNFTDFDVFDIYTPLQSLHRSNRYELVRNNTI